MESSRRQTNNGFTLLELLVAITIFATMSIMAYGGLSNVITNSDASEQALLRLKNVQLTMFNVERDLSQVTKRNIRDEFGTVKSYIEAGNNIDYIIEFTRNGRRNPAHLLRSHLVRVAYKINDGKLTRVIWPQLDRVQGMVPDETVLLTDVKSVKIRFLDSDNKWNTAWPPLNESTSGTPVTLSAIEYKMTLDDWGEISRLFIVNQ